MLKFAVFISVITVFYNNTSAHSQVSNTGGSKTLLQFTAQGHTLGFQPGAFIVAGTDHVLKVGFVDAQSVIPQTTADHSVKEPLIAEASAMGTVTYADLWPGVSLVFESERGLVESFYHIVPDNHPPKRHAGKRSVDRIRLRYNVPVALDPAGNLVLGFKTGQIRESAPVAWQQIAGRRVPIPIAFRILDRCEVGFEVAPYDPAYKLVIDPVMTWNTFLGATASMDYGRGMALDAAGNIYVSGYSDTSWGLPVNPHQGGIDAYVAKLDAGGNLIWNTFLGSSGDDWGYGLTLDADGHLYTAGYGQGSWGTPINEHTGGIDTFVARLNSDNGARIWHTFMGSSGSDYGYRVVSDTGDRLYVAGRSDADWGVPIDTHAGGPMDVYVTRLDAANGHRIWHTFMGSAGSDFGYGLALDTDGNLYVGGRSDAAWGQPVNDHTADGNYDAFVAKLNNSGRRIWHTFMGSGGGFDYSASVTVDTNKYVYLTGYSDAAWGTPINGHAGNNDPFVAKLDTAIGSLIWHTFMGSAGDDQSSDIALDAGGDLYVVGFSDATWGTPTNAHAGSTEGFAVKLDNHGKRLWNTFMGSSGGDLSFILAVDDQDNAYITGRSDTSWGAPVMMHSGGGSDAFVAKLEATYKLTVHLTGIGNGRVTAVPSGIDCGIDCVKEFDQGTLITLTASPETGMTFSGWAGVGCAGTGVCTTTMEADRIIRSHFNNPALDTDGDGISNKHESGPLANDPDYDGNGDGIADWDQAGVVSSPSADGTKYATLSVPDQISITAADTLEKPHSTDPPEDIDFELGFFDFTINHTMVGDAVSMTFRLEEGVAPDTYYKFGPTPDNPVDHWYEFLYDGETGAQINDNVVTLYFKDGQRGDSDLDDTNGIIADPGGPGFSYSGGGGQSSSGAGCFISRLVK